MKNLLYLFNEHLLIKNLFTKNLFTLLVLIVFLLPHYACNTTEPPINNNTLTLKLEDVSCTEAWLQLTTPNIQIPNNITLYINNQPKETINLTTADTLLYIDSLLPNQTYKIIAAMEQTNNRSNELSITTMDTTSHNFTWQTFEFGEHSSSTLYDVAIIDENDIWAVGEIFMNDSLGNPDPIIYNAVHWNGQSWKLLRIPSIICGAYTTIYSAIYTICVFNKNSIFFSDGGEIIYFNGQEYSQDCSINSLLTGKINKLWGSSRSNLYVVGNKGNIANYNGSKWTKIESGTILNINDIWGDYNEKTQEWEILAVCGNILHGWEDERVIIRIINNQSVQINADDSKWPLSGIWFKSGIKYYVVGSGIYQQNKLGNIWQGEPLDITEYFVSKITANDINDVVAAGAYGEIVHFNGMSWESYINDTYIPNGTFLSSSIKDNFLISVGYQSAKAIITIGNR